MLEVFFTSEFTNVFSLSTLKCFFKPLYSFAKQLHYCRVFLLNTIMRIYKFHQIIISQKQKNADPSTRENISNA